MLFAVIPVRNSHRREFVFDFFYVFGITVSDDLAVIDRNVTYSVVEIVPGREHVMLHRHKRFGGHVRRSEVARRFAFPVFINLVKGLFGILGNIEGICRAGCDRIEFLFEPFERKFGKTWQLLGRIVAEPTISSPSLMIIGMLSRICSKAFALLIIIGSPSVAL